MSIPIKALPEHAQMVENVLSVYRDASPEEVAEGLEWYDMALRLGQSLAAGSNYTLEQCVGVIAAISPRVDWGLNSVYPAHILNYHQQEQRNVKSWRYGSKGMNVMYWAREKALAILDGENPEDVLGKTKSWNFYLNIMGDANAVTIDSWAMKVVLKQPDLYDNPSPSSYEKVADAYRDAAEMVGISPRAMQATTWVVYRNLYGRVR